MQSVGYILLAVTAILFALYGMAATEATVAMPVAAESPDHGVEVPLPNGNVATWVVVVALTALVGALGFLLKVTIPSLLRQNEQQRQENNAVVDRLAERWDGWEKMRHDDHESLEECLRNMADSCAQTRAAMEAAVRAKR